MEKKEKKLKKYFIPQITKNSSWCFGVILTLHMYLRTAIKCQVKVQIVIELSGKKVI